MRAFIGILAPKEVRGPLLKVMKQLEAAGVVGKYVGEETLHVNLSFLGEITAEESMEFGAKLDQIAGGYGKFSAELFSIRAIPNERLVRVIAVGVKQENDLLVSLSRDIKNSIGGDVKPPHMTLCRVKGLKDRKGFSIFLEQHEQESFAFFEITSIQLIKSELGSAGPIYSVVHESALRKQ